MVLTRLPYNLALVILSILAALTTGCGQSLFDAHGSARDGGGDDGGDGDVPDTCAAPCLADAGADFDGSAGGKGNHWRYLDDHRNRTWTPMTAGADTQVGAEPGNSFKRCANTSSSDACSALPGALLVSTAGKTSAADPAIEYRVEEARVIRLAVRARVESGAPGHAIRLYRNSREDVLFTLPATAGATVERQITVDALPGDRFLVAAAPDNAGGAVALHVFVSDPRATFPVTCQIAVPFSVAGSMANTVDDLCRGELRSYVNGAPGAFPPLAGPYAEQGDAAYLENTYYEATEPLTSGDALTLQLWVQAESSSVGVGWELSNIDVDLGRGIGLRLDTGGKLVASVVKSTSPLMYAEQSVNIVSPSSWHFVRVVHASDAVSICVDGKKLGGGALTGPLPSSAPVNIGRNVGDAGSYFGGSIDDVRVFLEALPCE